MGQCSCENARAITCCPAVTWSRFHHFSRASTGCPCFLQKTYTNFQPTNWRPAERTTTFCRHTACKITVQPSCHLMNVNNFVAMESCSRRPQNPRSVIANRERQISLRLSSWRAIPRSLSDRAYNLTNHCELLFPADTEPIFNHFAFRVLTCIPLIRIP